MPNPSVLLEIYGLYNLFLTEIESAKSIDSDSGEEVTPQEMLAIAIAVLGPALRKFFIPALPDEAIEKALSTLTTNFDRARFIRAKASSVLDHSAQVALAGRKAFEETLLDRE